jgi:hypothetical protein
LEWIGFGSYDGHCPSPDSFIGIIAVAESSTWWSQQATFLINLW